MKHHTLSSRPLSRQTPFFNQLYDEIEVHGGIFNSHLHLDRAGTIEERYQKALKQDAYTVSYISLQEKHKRIYDIHESPAYEIDDLKNRVNFYLDTMIEVGTTRADTLVDTTLDRVELSALEVLLDIKHARANEIDLQIGAYSPMGFKDSVNERWQLFEKGCKITDFIGLLPEVDDTAHFSDHIGFYEHCKRGLILAQELNKTVHVHTDQRVVPNENGTEQLIKAIKEFGSPKLENNNPSVWAVHVVSPTTYDELRFQRLVDDLNELNVGIICCPSAALGMRQLRPIESPTDNSIPRVLDFLAAGIPVRIGSDNIADICSPSTTADLIDEIIMLSAALRFYNPRILGKLAAGVNLNTNDQNLIIDHLENNNREIKKSIG